MKVLKKRIALLVLSVLVFAGALIGGAYAWFTGDKVVNSIIIETGSVNFASELYLSTDFNRDGWLDVVDEADKIVAETVDYREAADGYYEFTKLRADSPIRVERLMPGEIVTFRIDVVNQSTAQSAGNVSLGMEFGTGTEKLRAAVKGRRFALDHTAGAWTEIAENASYLPILENEFYAEQSSRITLLFQICFWDTEGDQGDWNAETAFEQCKIRIRFDAVTE